MKSWYYSCRAISLILYIYLRHVLHVYQSNNPNIPLNVSEHMDTHVVTCNNYSVPILSFFVIFSVLNHVFLAVQEPLEFCVYLSHRSSQENFFLMVSNIQSTNFLVVTVQKRIFSFAAVTDRCCCLSSAVTADYIKALPFLVRRNLAYWHQMKGRSSRRWTVLLFLFPVEDRPWKTLPVTVTKDCVQNLKKTLKVLAGDEPSWTNAR